MTRSLFLLITAIGSFAFGAMMFLLPHVASGFLAITASPQTIAVLRGLGGLIIGSAAINYFLSNETNLKVISALLLANMITHLLGLSADVWGFADGALQLVKMAPVEITHLFVGLGSLYYYLNSRYYNGQIYRHPDF